MALSAVQSAQDRVMTEQIVTDYNSQINAGKTAGSQSLGQDEFLQLLVTQLSHQDPTNPMEDKEFIAQMAQFSQLEAITNMSTDLSTLTSMLTGSEAVSALGREVEIFYGGDSVVQGQVQAVTRGSAPQILVNGTYYGWDQVTKVFEE
jgi:flagellar basal-body rod modification protein FlgD